MKCTTKDFLDSLIVETWPDWLWEQITETSFKQNGKGNFYTIKLSGIATIQMRKIIKSFPNAKT